MKSGIWGYRLSWQTASLGPGKRSYAFLPVSLIPGDRRTGILQVQGRDGAVEMTAFTPAPGGGYARAWHGAGLGQRLGKSTFLAGRSADGGLTETIQIRADAGRLGMIVYRPAGRGEYAVGGSIGDLGPSRSVLGFLTAGAGVVVLRDHGGRLGATLLSPAGSSYAVAAEDADLGDSARSLQFFALDVNGDGRDEIVELQDCQGRLGMIVRAAGSDGFTRLFSDAAVGPSARSLAFLKARVSSDRPADLVQLVDHGGALGMAVYSPTAAGGLGLAWSSADLGRPSAAIQFLALDVDGDGRDEIVQLSRSGEDLSMAVYAAADRGGYAPAWSCKSLGHPAAALAFVPGGGGEILQVWPSAPDGSRLGLAVYSPVAM